MQACIQYSKQYGVEQADDTEEMSAGIVTDFVSRGFLKAHVEEGLTFAASEYATSPESRGGGA